MSETCPHCGQPWPGIRSAEALVAQMSIPGKDGKPRDVYESRAPGLFYITYGGGPISRSVIEDAIAKGMIVPKWPDVMAWGYWSLPATQPPAPAGEGRTET